LRGRNRADADTALCNLFEVEGMSLDALCAGVDWRFEDLARI
jgi:hypothetical protein